MATPSTRENLKQYALRSLGKPVIEINVDNDQLEDRIDEALQFYVQYHYCYPAMLITSGISFKAYIGPKSSWNIRP